MPLCKETWFIIDDVISTYVTNNGIESIKDKSKDDLKTIINTWIELIISRSTETPNSNEVGKAIITHYIWDPIYPDNDIFDNI